MESNLLLGFFCCLLFCAISAQSQNGGTLNFEVGGKEDKSNIMKIFNKLGKTVDDSESGDGSGDDDKEIYSGSGSGEPEVQVTTTLKPVTVTKIKTKTESKSTVMVINEGTKKPSSSKKTTESNEIRIKSTQDPFNKVGKQVDDDPAGEPSSKVEEVEAGVNFTVGIIVGVVVGAILAILVIVFLVYRLRKKDEGSYSLDEPSSQAFIRDEKNGGGQGKEYFA
jgi:hypothetical protein